MQLTFSEEQNSLARTALDFATKHCPVTRFRALRTEPNGLRYSPEIFAKMAELGWLGVHIPEEYGGVELGFSELAIILENLGRTLTPEPIVSSTVMGGYALLLGADEHLRESLLPEIATGERVFTFAHQEKAYDHRRELCATRAEKVEGGWKITGEKVHVMDGAGASDLLVVARVSGADDAREGLGIFHIAADTAGVERTALTRLDFRNAANIRFNGAIAQAIREPGNAFEVVEKILDRATIALCAEALGGLRQAFDVSVQYLKDRVQFGVPIGSFQALQHRASKLFAEVELTRSIVLGAARAVDQEPARVPHLASAAKATLDEAFLHVTREGVQFHGGVGVTDEYDIGLYLKRAHVVAASLGDVAFHRERWATLQGY